MTQKIRWGIVGLGNIAEKFAQDLSVVKDTELVSVASRSREKAEKFASKYNVKNAYDSYTSLFHCTEVDVIYIATPHTLHAELSIEAMSCGKHILCEKPMAVNASQLKRMIAAAVKNKVFLMEALWSRFLPSIIQTKVLIGNNTIGAVTHMNVDFAFYGMDRPATGRVLNPNLAGGSLLDIGIYPVFLAYLILGKPKNILASANFHSTGIEKQISVIFNYDNAQALLYSGLTSNSEVKAEITGDKGSIILEPRWHHTENLVLNTQGQTERMVVPKLGLGYAHEILEVNACIRSGKLESSLWSHQNSLDLINLLDDIRKISGIVFPFEA
ncbi:Gfo/Idh/MocA family oxidoreductase [Cellulophaga sp. F20128]|uniref:Gfo/Idh/MocA family protein n=1 Tax=Cellulophaga sp. F20128 TaxID=2926413 RepID=UPI001FF2E97B|nr:Gfo/Idh/MocA family oxidoreductase [Cellulophaga sp. F20128]MCK0156645.1 Gfo/Idh/MocA family oxidoreductase [Cellulophaga sp. F20128]